MKTYWEYSTETEARRILHLAYEMAVGFFRINNFYVLPAKPNAKYLPQAVRFPDLPYTKIPRFWDKVKLLDISTLPLKVDKELVKKVSQLLLDAKIKKPDYKEIKMKWEKAHKEILDEIWKIMPDKKKSVSSIVINPTIFGTTCSFSYEPDNKGQIYITLREDNNIHCITEAILTCLTRKDVYDGLEGEWSESELLVDWLLTKSSLNKILKKYDNETNFIPTLKSVRVKQNAKLLKESDEFYNKLGLSVNKKVFDLKGNEPTIHKSPAANLTATEKLILKILIEKANNVTSFDDLGNLLFTSPDNFSLYAISKVIQRLRDKLEENGISGSYIQTLRGQGYILKN